MVTADIESLHFPALYFHQLSSVQIYKGERKADRALRPFPWPNFLISFSSIFSLILRQVNPPLPILSHPIPSHHAPSSPHPRPIPSHLTTPHLHPIHAPSLPIPPRPLFTPSTPPPPSHPRPPTHLLNPKCPIRCFDLLVSLSCFHLRHKHSY
ncbi:hypothetical protein Pmani_040105 [Petrolisthes manimaculis]|uniref:Uncharacterized protein n=1 Tax=Petrolisthes manimaculis TaxID=1843537 RepID=A0AAE1NCS5_9EUCA|nr:hypothetical protein Pmani_040105 [Petrolisthes manimaculis]